MTLWTGGVGKHRSVEVSRGEMVKRREGREGREELTVGADDVENSNGTPGTRMDASFSGSVVDDGRDEILREGREVALMV